MDKIKEWDEVFFKFEKFSEKELGRRIKALYERLVGGEEEEIMKELLLVLIEKHYNRVPDDSPRRRAEDKRG